MHRLTHWLRDGSLLFFLLPAVYFLLYGFHGFADTDQGFVPGLAWRVLNGQVPYLDFCYVRPPLTPYLHAVELALWPKTLEMIGMRLDFYLMLWASVYWGVRTLRGMATSATFPVGYGWLACLAYVFGAHNFPAMPWHTMDGIFFGSLGVYLLSHPRARWRLLVGLLALAVAGLAKQPFALLLPLGMGLLFVLQPARLALKINLVATAILVAVASIGLWGYFPAGFLPAMLTQTAGASGLSELLQAGLLDYLWPGGLVLLGVGGAFWGLRRVPGLQPYWPWVAGAMLLALGLYPMAMGAWATWKMAFVPPRLGVYHALLGCTALQVVALAGARRRPEAAALAMLGAIAWTSSLSWGYAVPALFALPGLYAFLHLTQSATDTRLPKMLKATIALAFIGFFLMQRYPYRDAPRHELVAGAGDIFPALGGIRTSPTQIAKMREYVAFRQEFPNAATLPAMPAADYLMGMQPTLPIDWEHDAEIGPRQLRWVTDRLYTSAAPVLVELLRIDEAHSANLHYRSTLLAEVLDHWLPSTKGNFFQVYLPPGSPPAISASPQGAAPK
jgi:hypothetical protein